MATRSTKSKNHHDPLLVLLGAGAVVGAAASPYVKKFVAQAKPYADEALAKVTEALHKKTEGLEKLVSEMRAYYRATEGGRKSRV